MAPRSFALGAGGSVVATGGGDAKVKLWSPSSGFCFVTFHEHTAAVMDVAFVPHGRAVRAQPRARGALPTPRAPSMRTDG